MLQSTWLQQQQSKYNTISCTKVRCISLVCSFRISSTSRSWVLTKMSSDTPFALALAALESIPALTDTKDSGFAWTVYTGDLVSHDPDSQLSRSVLLLSIHYRSSFFLSTGVTLNMPRYSTFNLYLIIFFSIFNRL